MTIDPFLAGILITIGVELLCAFVLILASAIKYYKNNTRR